MAAIKFKSALGVERSCEEGFGGIDRTAHYKSGDSCCRMENLDTNADGSLESRPGYTPKLDFSGEFRGKFYSADKLYSVAGDSFILTDTSSDTSKVLAKLPSTSGTADIFCFCGDMYVHDGSRLYRYDGEKLTEVDGYAPLYGSAWHPVNGGDINEDINILSDRIRISFVTVPNTDYFNLGIEVASVDLIELNGKISDPDNAEITIDARDPTVLHSSFFASTAYITFWVTLSEKASQKYRLKRTSNAFVFGSNGGERLCIYNPGLSGHLLCSRPISANDQRASIKSAPDALPIYIPASSAVCVGSGAYPITGMAQHFDRALLFTETDTWCVDWEGDELDAERALPKIFMLNSAIGSEPIRGTAYCENDPLTYYCGGLWRWHSQSGVRDECSASLISDEVANILPKDSEHISMLSIPQRQQILISDAEDTEGKLLVYNTARKTWTLYSNIFAEDLLRYGDRPAFIRGGCIYAFSDGLDEDIEDDEAFAVKTTLISHFLDFGCPERIKRSARILLSADLSGGRAAVTLENENGEKRSFYLNGKPGGGQEEFSERVALPRFKKLRYIIESENRVRYCNAILSAK